MKPSFTMLGGRFYRSVYGALPIEGKVAIANKKTWKPVPPAQFEYPFHYFYQHGSDWCLEHVSPAFWVESGKLVFGDISYTSKVDHTLFWNKQIDLDDYKMNPQLFYNNWIFKMEQEADTSYLLYLADVVESGLDPLQIVNPADLDIKVAACLDGFRFILSSYAACVRSSVNKKLDEAWRYFNLNLDIYLLYFEDKKHFCLSVDEPDRIVFSSRDYETFVTESVKVLTPYICQGLGHETN